MQHNGKFYESDFELAFLDLLQDNNMWQYTHGDDLVRLFTDPLIEKDLREYINARYSAKNLTSDEVDMIVSNLRNVSGQNDYYALQNTFYLYRDGYEYTPQDGGLKFQLEYIDFENPSRNIFRCVNQFVMEQGKENRRPDILLFINGIPVCIIELKNPTDANATIEQAHEQIYIRYKRDIPNLTKYCALAVISDAAKTELGSTYTPLEFFYEWKKVENEDKAGKGLDTLKTLVRGALSPERILEILRDYVYFPDPSESDDTLQVVCRYPQFFGTRKLINHITNHLRSVGGDGKGGTYFGATGCGKTYTMLFLSRQLAMRCKSKLGSPTIVLLVDREDLQNQAGDLFCKSKKYLGDESVRVFDSCAELAQELTYRKTGGFFITTIQKFRESTGLLSDRANIVCMSDEAHRTQNNLGSKMVINDKPENGKVGAHVTYGFAKYLRDALPNATYVGFTGTPTDDAVHVFGDIVDQYTMMESEADGITVPIKYDPRLARVFLDKEQADAIEAYYKACADEGTSDEDIAKSKAAMASMMAILDNDDRLKKVAKDITTDFMKRLDTTDRLQKGMIVCADRAIAFRLYNFMKELKPEWFEPRKTMNDALYTAEELEKLKEVAYVNLVATQGANDPKDLYETCGDKDRRKFLEKEFKSKDSNFHLAIVVDMWITGFDVPSLTYLYNDKPLSKHTLIQTISRVNRKYKDKECGVIIDYLGIREEMRQAMKKYGGNPISQEDLEVAYQIFSNELQILKELMNGIDFAPFFSEDPLTRLQFLHNAAEYILEHSMEKKGTVSLIKQYLGHVKKMSSAYNILNPAGLLSDDEAAWAQCFMGISSYVIKMTASHHDVATMNKRVSQMVQEAITCSGVELLLDHETVEENIFSDEFVKELEDVKMPHTRFQMLLKLVARAIREYAKTNKLKAEHFQTMLEDIVKAYNTRENLVFANDVANDAVNALTNIVTGTVDSYSDALLQLLKEINKDKEQFKKLGITFEEKAFFDVLIEVRDKHGFEYPEEKCISLAKKIKTLVDNMTVYANFMNNDNLKSQLSIDLTYLLYEEGYPPEWDEEVFTKVLGQVNNYKKHQAPMSVVLNDQQPPVKHYDLSRKSYEMTMVADETEMKY